MSEKKYVSLYKEIKEKIIEGIFPSGKKLPSKRDIALKKAVSIITVEKAYSMLAEEGYIEAKERSGYFVRSLPMQPNGTKLNSGAISYLPLPRPPFTDTETNSALWFKTVRKVISEKGQELFLRSPNKGCAILRNAISEYLYRYRGMLAQPENIIIGSGSEQLYENVVMLLGRQKTYGIEDPSYIQIETVYKGLGANIRKLRMGCDGIESAELNKKNFDVLHVTPFKSYPSGVTANAAKRYEYLCWAYEKNGRYITEDDFASEFFLPGQPIESLYSLDTEEKVIYINTFSKSISPSMRMGYMILPPSLISKYEEVLGVYSCSVPVLDQYILAEFISSGSFERHLNKTRRKMSPKL